MQNIITLADMNTHDMEWHRCFKFDWFKCCLCYYNVFLSCAIPVFEYKHCTK